MRARRRGVRASRLFLPPVGWYLTCGAALLVSLLVFAAGQILWGLLCIPLLTFMSCCGFTATQLEMVGMAPTAAYVSSLEAINLN